VAKVVHPTFPERALGALEDEVMGARGPLGRVDGALSTSC
jgi:hypothetical protein